MNNLNLNTSQIQAKARENNRVAVRTVNDCFCIASMYKDYNMTDYTEYSFNVEIIQVILEGFISDSCYPTFNSKFKTELAKLGYEVVFGDEGCGYMVKEDNSLVIYFG